MWQRPTVSLPLCDASNTKEATTSNRETVVITAIELATLLLLCSSTSTLRILEAIYFSSSSRKGHWYKISFHFYSSPCRGNFLIFYRIGPLVSSSTRIPRERCQKVVYRLVIADTSLEIARLRSRMTPPPWFQNRQPILRNPKWIRSLFHIWFRLVASCVPNVRLNTGASVAAFYRAVSSLSAATIIRECTIFCGCILPFKIFT